MSIELVLVVLAICLFGAGLEWLRRGAPLWIGDREELPPHILRDGWWIDGDTATHEFSVFANNVDEAVAVPGIPKFMDRWGISPDFKVTKVTVRNAGAPRLHRVVVTYEREKPIPHYPRVLTGWRNELGEVETYDATTL